MNRKTIKAGGCEFKSIHLECFSIGLHHPNDKFQWYVLTIEDIGLDLVSSLPSYLSLNMGTLIVESDCDVI